MKSIVLVQPHEGVYNKVFKPWVPLSLICTAAKLDQEGYPITIIDQRINENWKAALLESLAQKPVCVGVTSMTGSQVLGALEASKLVKENSRVPVVWGGVHSTLFPDQTLANDHIDIIVKHEGEETFYQLVKRLEAQQPLNGLAGICYKQDGKVVKNPDRPFIEPDELPPPPYHLVKVNDYLHQYFSEKRVLELESSRGCPYACAFCYNALFNKRAWRPWSAEQVIERIRHLADRYSVRAFHFIDDAFFIDRHRVNEIMRGIVAENLPIRIGFQGIRIDNLCRMEDHELDLLYRAGTRFFQFGVESGSPRILEMINKKIRVEDVISLNRRLAKFPKLIPYYNFMCGLPTETKKDLFDTTRIAWTLLQENKNALISPFHHYKPYPGTVLSKIAMNESYCIPKNLEEWGYFDWTEAVVQDRDKKTDRLHKKVEMTSIFADHKLELQSDSMLWTFMAKLYRPVARFRLRNNFYSLMPESILIK